MKRDRIQSQTVQLPRRARAARSREEVPRAGVARLAAAPDRMDDADLPAEWPPRYPVHHDDHAGGRAPPVPVLDRWPRGSRRAHAADRCGRHAVRSGLRRRQQERDHPMLRRGRQVSVLVQRDRQCRGHLARTARSCCGELKRRSLGQRPPAQGNLRLRPRWAFLRTFEPEGDASVDWAPIWVSFDSQDNIYVCDVA